MKRNLSSQAIKAMAIGMAVMMGSTTAISGVVKGTVVNAYASDIVASVTNPDSLSSVAAGHFVATPDGLLFKIKTEGSKTDSSGDSNDDGTLVLVGTVTEPIGVHTADGTQVPYKAKIEGNKVVVETEGFEQDTTGGKILFEVEEIGDGTNPLAVATISDSAVPDFSGYSTPSTIDGSKISSTTLNIDDANGLTIKTGAFKGVTLTGDLVLSGKISTNDGAFKGIKGDGSSIDLSGATGGTIDGGSFSDSTGTEKTTYGTLKIKDFTSKADSFNNVDVTGSLEFTGTPTLGTAGSFKSGTAGNTIKKLVLPTTFNGGSDGLFANNSDQKYTITTLDLTGNTNALTDGTFKNTAITNLTHNGKALMNGSNIKNLTFASGVTEVEANAFKGATVSNPLELKNIKTLKASALEIANADATSEPSAVTIKMPDFTVDAGVDNGVTNAKAAIDANAFGASAGKHIKLVLPDTTDDAIINALKTGYFGNTNVKVGKADPVAQAPTLKTATIENDAPNKVVLTFSENIKVASVDNQPAPTEFTVMVGEQANVVTSVSQIAQDTSSNTVTLTLTTPVKKGEKVTVAYTSGANKILNSANTELANFEATQVTNNVGSIVEVEGDFVSTTNNGTYTFTKVPNATNEVQLVKFELPQGRKSATNVKFNNGKFTVNNVEYTLTKIGDGKTPLDTITTEALEGHTAYVTEIAANAFKGNTAIKTLSFPKVETVGGNAFNGATNLTNIDLGSATSGSVTVDRNAFDSIKKPKVVTNKESESAIGAIVGSGNVTTTENANPSDAEILTDKFYQTKEGLKFRGIGTTVNNKTNSLEFIGKENFAGAVKPDGTSNNPYIVTYKDGVVTLVKGETPQVPEKVETVTVNKGGTNLTFNIESNNEATLTAANKVRARASAPTGILEDGVVIAKGQNFKFTKIGNGTTPLSTDFDATTVLGDADLKNVTTISAKAFEGNTVTSTLTLPAITTIGDNAFNGATALTKVDLGTNKVTVGASAFKNTTTTIASENQETINDIVSTGGASADKVESTKKTFVTSANVDEAGKKIILTLSKAVDLKTPADFTVNIAGQDKSSDIQSVSTSSKTVTITLNTTTITKGQKVLLGYKGSEIEQFTNKNVTNKIGVITLDSATVENAQPKKIVLTFDKDLTEQLNDSTELTIKVNGEDKTSDISGVVTSSKTVTITLNNTTIKNGDNIKVSYTGSKVTEFTDFEVENKVTKADPVTISAATADATKITLTITEGGLKNISQQAPTGFTVTKGNNEPVTLEPTGLTVTSNNTIELTVQDGISATDGNIKVTYDGSNEQLVKQSNNKPVTIAGTKLVDNTTDSTPPTFSALTGKYENGTITLTADEYLKPISKASDNGFSLELTALTGRATVTNVEIAEDSKEIVLTIDEGSLTGADGTIKVKYTQPNGGNNIADINGNEIVTDDSTGVDVTVTGRSPGLVMGYVEYATIQQSTGNVTTINVIEPQDVSVIQSMITPKLTHIASLKLDKNIDLDFRGVDISNLTISRNAITGGTLNITGLNASDELTLANKLINAGVSNVTVGNKTPEQVVDNNNYRPPYNNGSSSSGSSSGSSGGGAIIGGVTDSNTENNNNNNSNSGSNNNQVSENKQLTFDVIKLPSINGEPKMFGDVSASHWAKTYIDKLSTAGIINGANGNFMPNGQTKRADVTIMLVNLLGLTPEANGRFADVNANAYYAPYVGTASSYGIVNGSNGMFNPEGIISRQDTMVMIAQILKGLNLNINTDASSLGQFSDLGSVSSYAQESVAILVNSGIITGNNGKLNPKAPVTRAEMATIMSKLYDVLAATK